MDLENRVQDLFDRFTAQDAEGVSALCAPTFRAKQNNGPTGDAETMLAGLQAGLWGNGFTATYSDVRRVIADTAVTEQHVVTVTRPDGVSASSDVCVVVRFDEHGLITRLDEYLDSAAFAALYS